MNFSNDDSWKVVLPSPNVDRPNSQEANLRSLVFPDPEGFVEGLEGLMEAGEPENHRRLWESMGVSGDDFTVSPLSLRLGCLGASRGVSFYHHELRTDIPVEESLLPEVASGQGGWVPTWENGVLTEPRYFSFRMDGRLQCYNPNHRRQWRPHEVMHGCAGFFWRPDMTRFEAYLGARLNELLPVIHWYGWDEVFRPVCAAHRGQRLYHTYCRECEAAAKPYWELTAVERKELRDPAIAHVAFGIEHWTSEWEACLRELESGVRHSVTRPKLDASSDALGYVLGHWNRLTAWSMGAWMERFMLPGVDYFQSTQEQARSVLKLHEELLFGEIEAQSGKSEALKHRRIFQDYAYRFHLAVEHLEEGSRAAGELERVIEPALVAMEGYCKEADGGPLLETRAIYEALDEAISEAGRFLPGTIGDSLPGVGVMARLSGVNIEESLVSEGLQSTFTHFEEANAYCEEPLAGFVESADFAQPGRVGERYLKWLTTTGCTLPKNYEEELRFEMAILTSMGKDQEGEYFGSLPEGSADLGARGSRVRLNSTARRRGTLPEVAQTLLGLSKEDLEDGVWDGVMHVGIASFEGSVRGIALAPAQWEVWEKVREGAPLDEDDLLAVIPLIERAFVFWGPPPR